MISNLCFEKLKGSSKQDGLQHKRTITVGEKEKICNSLFKK